jgi:hypothetical protein
MPGRLPQLEIKHIGCDNLIVAPHSILISDQFHELIVDLGAMWVPEPAPRGQLMMCE